MGNIIQFSRHNEEAVERDEPIHRLVSADLRALSLNLNSIHASLESSSEHAKTIVLQLERYKQSLSISKDFCERCMAAAAMTSLAEMVWARDQLTAAFASQSATEGTSIVIMLSAKIGGGAS